MTALLEKAFTAAAKLPASEQDALAAWILEELAADRRWRELFDASAEALEVLADEALAQHRRGMSRDLDPDRL